MLAKELLPDNQKINGIDKKIAKLNSMKAKQPRTESLNEEQVQKIND